MKKQGGKQKCGNQKKIKAYKGKIPEGREQLKRTVKRKTLSALGDSPPPTLTGQKRTFVV